MTKCSSSSIRKNKNKNGRRCRITPAYDNSKRIDLNLFLIGDNNVFYFKRTIVFRKYIVIDCKNCNFAIKNDNFDCWKCTFGFLNNLESGSSGKPVEYVRAYSVSSLTWTPISFVCLLNYYYCPLDFSCFLFLNTCPSLGSHFLWQDASMSPLTNYSQLSAEFFILAPKNQMCLRTCSIERASSNNTDIK